MMLSSTANPSTCSICRWHATSAAQAAPPPQASTELCCTPGTRCRFYNPWYWRCKAPGDVAEPEAPPSWSDVACTGRTRVSPLAAWLHQYDCMRLVAILLLCHVAVCFTSCPSSALLLAYYHHHR
jgi:hypothetical protein